MQNQEQPNLELALLFNLSKFDNHEAVMSILVTENVQDKYQIFVQNFSVDTGIINEIKKLNSSDQAIQEKVATQIVANVRKFLEIASIAGLTDKQQKEYLKKLIPNKEFVNKLTAAISNEPNVQDDQLIGMEEEEKVQAPHNNIDPISQNGLGVQDLNVFKDSFGIFSSIGCKSCITTEHFTKSNGNNGQEQNSDDTAKQLLGNEDNRCMLNGLSMYLYPEKSNSDNDKLSQELETLKDFIKSRKDNERYAFPFLHSNHYFTIGVEGDKFVILDNSEYLNGDGVQKEIIDNITEHLGLNHNTELQREAQKSCLEQTKTGFKALAEGGNSTSDSNNACLYHQAFNALLWTSNTKLEGIGLKPKLLHLIDIEVRGDNTKQEGEKMLPKAKQFFNDLQTAINTNGDNFKRNVLVLQEKFLTNYTTSIQGFVVKDVKEDGQKVPSTANGEPAGDKIDEVLTNNCQKATKLLEQINIEITDEPIIEEVEYNPKHYSNTNSNDGSLTIVKKQEKTRIVVGEFEVFHKPTARHASSSALEKIEEVNEEDEDYTELSNDSIESSIEDSIEDSIEVILKPELLQQQELPYLYHQGYQASIFYHANQDDNNNNDPLSQLYEGEESVNDAHFANGNHFINQYDNPFNTSVSSAKKNNVATDFDNVYEIDLSQSSINNNDTSILSGEAGEDGELNETIVDNNDTSILSGEAGEAEELDEKIAVNAEGDITKYKNNLDTYSIAANETFVGKQSQIPNPYRYLQLEDERSDGGYDSAEAMEQRKDNTSESNKHNGNYEETEEYYKNTEKHPLITKKKKDKTTPLMDLFSLITQSIVSFFDPITKWIKGLSQDLGKYQGYNEIAEEEGPQAEDYQKNELQDETISTDESEQSAQSNTKYQKLLQKAHELESELESELGMNSRSNLNASIYNTDEQDSQGLYDLIYQSQPEQDYLPDDQDANIEQYLDENQNPNLNVAIIGKRTNKGGKIEAFAIVKNDDNEYSIYRLNGANQIETPFVSGIKSVADLQKILNNNKITTDGTTVLIEMPKENVIEFGTYEDYQGSGKLSSQNFEEEGNENYLDLYNGNAGKGNYSDQALNHVDKLNKQDSRKFSGQSMGRL